MIGKLRAVHRSKGVLERTGPELLGLKYRHGDGLKVGRCQPFKFQGRFRDPILPLVLKEAKRPLRSYVPSYCKFRVPQNTEM